MMLGLLRSHQFRPALRCVTPPEWSKGTPRRSGASTVRTTTSAYSTDSRPARLPTFLGGNRAVEGDRDAGEDHHRENSGADQRRGVLRQHLAAVETHLGECDEE